MHIFRPLNQTVLVEGYVLVNGYETLKVGVHPSLFLILCALCLLRLMIASWRRSLISAFIEVDVIVFFLFLMNVTSSSFIFNESILRTPVAELLKLVKS
ncbi:unnamed protein product [Moneuplotes crassus]|uniref:Uncharacterized protein n=1 Tax=Euplotes crassus TaxID=5936 RepID=A0AAD1UBK2_EUPCR|nr:unnamed protein product [Moneuplotes crassus]